MVRILIADADAMVRARLRRLLEQEPGWQVCGEAANGAQAVELALKMAPHVAVLDLAMPEINGLEATRRIRKALPNTEVLIFATHEADDVTRDLLSAGARGYLLTSDADEKITAAVDALSQHRPYLTGKATRAVLDVYLKHADAGTRPFRILTAREREVLQLLAEGRGNTAISALLSISVKTVETHRAAIMRKLGISSLAELVRYAIRNSVIEET